jgi:hypothetical protein
VAKSALMTTARQDVRKEDGTTRADPFDFGAGHVDPEGRASRAGSIFNPGLAYNAGFNQYLGFLCDAAPEALANPAVTCPALAAAGIPIVATNLNYPSIAVSEVPGARSVIRTVTNVSDETETYRASVDEPDGFEVTVTPDRLTLAPGESATFEVAFINEDAPVGEWRFGSLSWVDGRNRVRSPIAVKAAAIEFPGTVEGAGPTGTVSIPVAFGYTGANANWSPVEVGAGTTEHPFTVGDSVHLRITLSAADLTSANPGATDLDIFLWKDGAQVASSTAGGTNEVIDIDDPAPGNYILYIQGWQVVDPPPGVGYTFHRWDVPRVASSLAIGTAPPSATLGTVGNVDATWTVAGPGNYLGAVSHSDGTTNFGYTLVEVDNTP